MTDIQKFYNGQNIFITGGTGYLGRVLIEKLLRSCPGIKKIYILVRPKREKTIEERLHGMFKIPMFVPLKSIDPNFERKIVPLSGDLMLPDLGLSHADRELIKKEVSIIFHAAATTRFDEPLKIALKINVESVKSIIDICKSCKNLKAMSYVSTAFSNCIYDHIEEKIYSAPLSDEHLRQAVKIIDKKNFSEKEEEQFTNLIIGKYPNTYCFTKAIAEELLSKEANGLPFSVYRFSIALSSLKEPVPGWIDKAQAITQTIIRVSKGMVRVLWAQGEFNMETVPIDLACNGLIASVWETGSNKKNGQGDLRVYNYVSSRDNPVTWNDLREFLRRNKYTLAIKNTIYYPDTIYVKSIILFYILHYLLHFIPAVLADIVLRIMGKTPRFLTVFERGTKLAMLTCFFTTGKWWFETENVNSLWNKLSENDKKIFNFDITSFNWEEMLQAYSFGAKKYFLREESTPEIQQKNANHVRRLFFVHQAVLAITYASVLWLFWKLYCLLFN